MSYANPLATLAITSGYRTPARPTHTGTDYRAPSGTTLFAAIDGVIKTGTGHPAAGTWIEIHGNGEMAGYSHLSGRVVKPGQTVRAGQIIGTTGATGNATGPHLHFYVMVAGKYTNPHTWIARKIAAMKATAAQPDYTTSDYLTSAQIRTMQQGFRDVFPAYRWRVNVRRGKLIEPDGIDGPQTRAWVEAFQRAVGIKPDKIVGPVTRSHLARYGIHI